jgi:5-methylcytosine-specific restriction enzyme subunit McrC
MSALAANRGGFVVPLTASLIPPPTSHIRGSDATLSIFGIEVSKENGSYSKFCSDMQAKEQSFINSINQGGPSQR